MMEKIPLAKTSTSRLDKSPCRTQMGYKRFWSYPSCVRIALNPKSPKTIKTSIEIVIIVTKPIATVTIMISRTLMLSYPTTMSPRINITITNRSGGVSSYDAT